MRQIKVLIKWQLFFSLILNNKKKVTFEYENANNMLRVYRKFL